MADVRDERRQAGHRAFGRAAAPAGNGSGFGRRSSSSSCSSSSRRRECSRPAGAMNWTQVSAQLGIVAIGACLLMIAGEFDLSVGSMIAFSGMIMALDDQVRGRARRGRPSCSPSSSASAIGWLIGYLVVTHPIAVLHRIARLPLHPARRHHRLLARRWRARRSSTACAATRTRDWVAWLFGGQIGEGLFTALADERHHRRPCRTALPP